MSARENENELDVVAVFERSETGLPNKVEILTDKPLTLDDIAALQMLFHRALGNEVTRVRLQLLDEIADRMTAEVIAQVAADAAAGLDDELRSLSGGQS